MKLLNLLWLCDRLSPFLANTYLEYSGEKGHDECNSHRWFRKKVCVAGGGEREREKPNNQVNGVKY